jgi:regulator of protease activity HflC (stomatin/prohibitin superfamily)
MYDDRFRVGRLIAKIVAGVVGLVAIVLLFASTVTIGTGEIAVMTRFGEVTGQELDSGFHWKNPFDKANEYDVKTQKEQQPATAATKDLQDATAEVVVNYHLNKGDVSDIHKTVGVDYKNVLITPAIQSSFKANSAKYTAVELINNRGAVEASVTTQLRERLEGRGIVVEEVSIVNLEFSKDFTRAIEQRQVAQQNAERAQYNLQQARLDAQSQEVQAKTLTENYLRLKSIENERAAIDAWNGVMPSTVGGNGNIFSIPVK